MAVSKHDGAEDRVFELADIARPVIGRQQRHGTARYRQPLIESLLGGEALDEGAYQNGDILLAPAQRRNGDREDVQPIVEIFAEPALANLGDKVLICGRDEAHIHLLRLTRPDRLDLALLDGAQQLDLYVERKIADFVEKEGAAVGIDELAAVLFARARKRSLLRPKRMLSTRLWGIAPQLTVTKGFAARSLAAWMARATISLPTPDSPSSTIGMSTEQRGARDR